MPKPKLAIINSSSILKSYGGVAPFIKNLDPFLQEAFEVTYILLPDYLYNIHFIPRRLIFSLYLIGKRSKWKAFDMILSHVPEGSFIVSYGRVPFIHIFHGNFNPMSQSRYWYGKYFMSIFEAMERRIIRKASLMYTVGAERPGIPKIFNPILHDVKIKNGNQRSGFIFSGRLEKIKNIDRIIRMYSKLDKTIQEENPLFIAGIGTQETILKNLAASLSIKGKIVFTGNLKNDDLVETVSSKKILVMASSQEGFPMSIAEALSVGVPVISTETGDIARILKNNENGFLIPIDFDDEQYIGLVECILKDYDRFSENALASSYIFQAERVAKTLIDDIHKTLAKN